MSASTFGTISRRRALMLGLLAPALGVGILPAAADDYPSKFIRLILPFPPGGGTDTLSRIIGKKMNDDLGQAVVIDNRPGAAGNIATMLAAKAPNDGYTLLMGFSTALTVNPALYPDLSVDVAKDFTPVSLIAEAEYVLVVNSNLPVHSLKELVDYAKAHPGTLNYSSSGIGGPLHLAGALLGARSGIDIVHLPFKGGAPAVLALLNGEAQMAFGSIAATLPNIKAGTLRPLAVSGLKRSELLPDVPTVAESGFPGFDVSTWYGFLGPAGLPQPVIAKLQGELTKVLADPDVQKNMQHEGLSAITSTSDQFANRIKSESTTWAKVIKDANIKLQ